MGPQRSKTVTADEPLRYGLIGVGMNGRGHIGCLRELVGVEIAAVADPHEPSRLQGLEALGREVPAYADHREMLEKETLDAVVVATPNYTHAEIVCDALEAGRHVLGEKPLDAGIDGCNRIVETAARTGQIYQIGLELRYSAVWRRVRGLIEEGRIGTVRQLWCKEFRGPWAQKVNQWITQKDKTGGALVEKDCHHFDLFNWFVGKRPLRAAGFGTCDLVYGAEHFGGITPDVLDNAQIVVQYDGGAVATLMLCMYCPGYQEGLEIGVIGTEGWIVACSGREDVLRLFGREGDETATIRFDLPAHVRKTSHGGAVYAEHVAFAANVRNGRRPLTDAVVGWWATAVPMAAERAVAEQRIVDVAEVGPAPAA